MGRKAMSDQMFISIIHNFQQSTSTSTKCLPPSTNYDRGCTWQL